MADIWVAAMSRTSSGWRQIKRCFCATAERPPISPSAMVAICRCVAQPPKPNLLGGNSGADTSSQHSCCLPSETPMNHSSRATESLINPLGKPHDSYGRDAKNFPKSLPLATPPSVSEFHANARWDDKWFAGVSNRCRRSPRRFSTQGSIAPAGGPPKGGGRLADRAAHVAGGSDVDCDLGARTIGIGVVLKTLQATNGTYIGPATRKRTAIRSTLIAGAGIGWGRTHLGDDECGAFFSKAHFLANHRASGSSLASLKIFRNGYSSQNTNDGHHDHQFNQGETFCCSLTLPKG